MEPSSDARLDAAAADDVTYLSQLGYRQELRRALGLFSSFGIQWTIIAVAGGTALTFGYGITTIGPLMFFAWLIAGGAYQIINRLANVRLGWQVGWWLVMAHVAAISAEAVGLAPFIANWIGIDLTSHGATLAWAFGLIVFCTVINVIGVKVAALVNNVGGVLCEFIAIAIVLVGVIGVLIFGHHDFHGLGFLTHTQGTVASGDSHLLPFLYAMLVPAFVISAFDANGTAGEETESAARTVPRGLLQANFATFILGTVMLLLTLLAASDFKGALDSSAPMTFILQDTIGKVPGKTFEVLAVFSLLINMMVIQLTAARVLWAQARDGQMPAARYMARLSREQVPATATLVTAVLAFAFAAWTSLLNVLIAMVAILWAAGYAVLVAVKLNAARQGRLPSRPFNLGRWGRLVDVVALVWSIALCAILVKSDPKQIGGGFLGTIAAGIVVYFLIPGNRRGKIGDVRAEAPAERSKALA